MPHKIVFCTELVATLSGKARYLGSSTKVNRESKANLHSTYTTTVPLPTLATTRKDSQGGVQNHGVLWNSDRSERESVHTEADVCHTWDNAETIDHEAEGTNSSTQHIVRPAILPASGMRMVAKLARK